MNIQPLVSAAINGAIKISLTLDTKIGILNEKGQVLERMQSSKD